MDIGSRLSVFYLFTFRYSLEMTQLPQVSFVVPLYNEQATLPRLKQRLDALMEVAAFEIEVVLINDGSKDQTETIIEQYSLSDPRYQAVSLSRNFGHQMAVSAGLTCARATEAIMVIDGDLQDPPELVTKFYETLKEGYDVVYGIRKKRKESLFKRVAYRSFYRLLKAISVIHIPLDSGDFSMMSRRVVDFINKMPEESRYIRGLRAWVGFNQKGIAYEREKRYAGDSKYSLRALFKLAYNGIFNFSEFPIKLITRLGFVTILISISYAGYALFGKLFYDTVPEGFTGLLFVHTLLGGVQLLSLGLIGEYVTRIFFQSKNRPLFIVKWRIVENKIKENG